MKRLSAVLIALSLAGCVSQPQSSPQLRPAFPPPPPPPEAVGPGGYRASEFAWSTAVGTNTIMGSLAHRTKTTQGWSCTGQSAALTPQTRYSTERMRTLYGSSDQALASVDQVRAKGAANPGADYSQFVRSTTCDDHNSFAFSHLPDGGYFVIVRVRPRTHGAAAEANTVLMQHVEVRGGVVRQIVLPEQPRPA